MKLRIHPAMAQGEVTIPPSKSMSHRVLLGAALAEGKSSLSNVGQSQDVTATIGAVEALGASVTETENGLTVNGIGGRLPDAPLTIDCGESGSTLRFLLPMLALTDAEKKLTGRGRLLSRPMNVYEELFQAQGILFSHTPERILVGGSLHPDVFTLRGDISSQFITGLLYALPLLQGESSVRILPPFESRSYVEMTLAALAEFGIRADFTDPLQLCIPGGQRYRAADVAVEGDYSQLAFFAVLASIRGKVCCHGMSEKTAQGDSVILRQLENAGAAIEWIGDGYRFSESPLKGQDIDLADCPDLGPILTVLGAYSEGETQLLNAGRLRIKESDRAAAMEEELQKLQVDIRCVGDSIRIAGRKGSPQADTVVSCHNDHRIAMSLAVFAACSEQPVILDGAECVNKSYPVFFEDLAALGVRVEVLED